MRYFLIPILLIVSSFRFNGDYALYCNSRFDFCVEYPASFSKLPKPDNDDGMTFLSADKKATISAFGSLATEPFETLDQELALAITDKKVTYKVVRKDWFILSGTDRNGNIFYRKTVKKKINYMELGETDVFQTLMLSYPPSQKQLYHSYCQKIAKSL